MLDVKDKINFTNNRQEKFIECARKIDETDIVLAYKSKRQFRKLFWTHKRKYTLNLNAVCNLKKKNCLHAC